MFFGLVGGFVWLLLLGFALALVGGLLGWSDDAERDSE
jgi:hypothetical protein